MSDIVKRKISWDDFEKDCRALADMVQRSGEIQGIVGIARGGLVATAIIANSLNIRNVRCLAVTSYHGHQQMTAEIFGSVDATKDGEGWIFIDDLVDTGQTAKLLKKRYPKAKLAVPYAKPEGQDTADFYIQKVAQDVWLQFPWEN